MTRTRQQTVSMTMWALIVSASIAHGQTPTSRTADRSEHQITNLLAQARPQKRVPFSLMSSFNITPMAAGPNLTVLGGGTLGRLTKWTGFTSSNSFIGDSTIFEDKLGNVGIGTDSPTARLTVNGLIQSLNGGLKFSDGTVQTSSAAGALFSVAHDATLTGNGTQASPLSAAPLVSAITGEPFHQQIDVPVPPNSLSGEATIVVGSKRMVIEYVSASCELPSPGFLLDDFEITTTLSGQTARYRFAGNQTVTGGGIDHYVVSQPVVIHADPGSTIKLRVQFPSPVSSAAGSFSISGRLFNVP